MRKGNTLYCKYEDKKSVYMITTKYKADMLRAERITFEGKEREFQRPFVVDRYNALMGGVDKCDQWLHYYGNNRKSLAWFKKIGIHFIERMCLNAYFLYRNQHPDYHYGYLKFIQEVVEGLFNDHSEGAKGIMAGYRHERPAAPQRGRAPLKPPK